MYCYGRCLSRVDVTCSTPCSLHSDEQFSVLADLQLARTWRCALHCHQVYNKDAKLDLRVLVTYYVHMIKNTVIFSDVTGAYNALMVTAGDKISWDLIGG